MPLPYVLVVDDEPAVARSAQLMLLRVPELAGFRVRACADATTALSWMTQEPPHLLLADYDLGIGVNGLDLCERARELAPGVRCILFSVRPQQFGWDARATDVVDAVVPKPLSVEALAAAVARVAAGR